MSNLLENTELRSEEVQEILDKVPHWMIRWGNLLFFVLIIILLVLTYVIKYPDVIKTEALLTTIVPPQKEYAKITGKLEAILIKDNEQVDPFEPLAIIENTANYKNVLLLKTIIDTIKINNTAFSFPIDSLPILFLGEIEAQYAIFENSYILYQLNKELKPYSNKEIANTYTISELNNRLNLLLTQKEINKTELNYKQKNLERNRTLFEKGIISTQEYENKQLEFAKAKRTYKNFEASISQIRESISNAQNTAVGTKFNHIKEDKIVLKNVIQSFNQLKKAIKDWEYLYVLKSNINGKISFLNYWNTNQTVIKGDLVFTIIPKDHSNYIAKLKIPALNSGKIKIGQAVHIRLENYPDTEFGILIGKVKNNPLIPDIKGLYHMDVELPTKLITSYNKEIDFKHEMRGTAEIITDDLRLIERFFYQFKKIVTSN